MSALHPEVGPLRDLTDSVVLSGARAELDRAERDGTLEAWARKWARPAVVCLEDLQERAWDADD